MNILLFAHKKEAGAFFKNRAFQKTEIGYRHDNDHIIFTGSGKKLSNFTIPKLKNVLMRNSVNRLINLGFAGILGNDAKPGMIFNITQVGYIGGKHKTYALEKLTFSPLFASCYSLPQEINKLNDWEMPQKGLVDMELFYLVQDLQAFPVPKYAVKVATDYYNDHITAVELKKQSDKFSYLLYDFYLTYFGEK